MALKATLTGLLAAVATLSACGTVANDPLLGAARAIATGLFNREEPAPVISPRQILTRDLINQAGVPLILIESTTTGVGSTLARIATNGPNETWQGNEGATLTLSREGVLRATRGLGPDLYSADIEGTRAALLGRRAGSVERLYVHVENDLEQIRSGYSCSVTFEGSEQIAIFGQSRTLTRVTEACSLHPTGERFENWYWIDSTGFAWVSEQWAGEDLGHYRIERLFR